MDIIRCVMTNLLTGGQFRLVVEMGELFDGLPEWRYSFDFSVIYDRAVLEVARKRSETGSYDVWSTVWEDGGFKERAKDQLPELRAATTFATKSGRAIVSMLAESADRELAVLTLMISAVDTRRELAENDLRYGRKWLAQDEDFAVMGLGERLKKASDEVDELRSMKLKLVETTRLCKAAVKEKKKK